MRQMPLPISLPERAIFENYVPGSNLLLFNSLKDVFATRYNDQQVFFWSKHRVGKSHLLHSVCHLAAIQKKQVAYIPLKELATSDPAIFDDLEGLDAICVDDAHLVVSSAEWATSLFRLINACRDQNTVLIISAVCVRACCGARCSTLNASVIRNYCQAYIREPVRKVWIFQSMRQNFCLSVSLETLPSYCSF